MVVVHLNDVEYNRLEAVNPDLVVLQHSRGDSHRKIKIKRSTDINYLLLAVGSYELP